MSSVVRFRGRKEGWAHFHGSGARRVTDVAFRRSYKRALAYTILRRALPALGPAGAAAAGVAEGIGQVISALTPPDPVDDMAIDQGYLDQLRAKSDPGYAHDLTWTTPEVALERKSSRDTLTDAYNYIKETAQRARRAFVDDPPIDSPEDYGPPPGHSRDWADGFQAKMIVDPTVRSVRVYRSRPAKFKVTRRTRRTRRTRFLARRRRFSRYGR